jgi:RNA polymerase sigma-70 factor (ECF subfamily)
VDDRWGDPWDWSLIRRRCLVEAGRVLDSPHDVEEAVQEALLRAWRGRESCRTSHTPIAWCAQIARNEALRLIGRRRRTASLEAVGELADRGAMSESDRAIRRVDVHRALTRLTPDERLLIALRYAEDCSQPEIARKLRMPEGTAKVRLHRARRQLKSSMVEHS